MFIFRFRECRVGKSPAEEGEIVVLDGDVKAKYHAFPQPYPSVRTCDLTYGYPGGTRTMSFLAYVLGKKTVKVSNITIDGTDYAVMNL